MYNVKIEFHKDFIEVEGNKIIVGLTSKPERGKANAELLKKIASYFNISLLNVKIVSGFKSRRKIVKIIT